MLLINYIYNNKNTCVIYTHAYIHTDTYIVHTYTDTYIHTYIHTYLRTYTYTRTYIHTYIHIYTHTYIHNTYLHTYTYTSTYVHIQTYIRTYIHTHTFIHIHTYIHTQRTAILATNSIRMENEPSRGCPQGSCSAPGYWNLQYNSVENKMCGSKQ